MLYSHIVKVNAMVLVWVLKYMQLDGHVGIGFLFYVRGWTFTTAF